MRPLAPDGDQCVGRAWRSSVERNSIVEIPSSRVDPKYSTPAKRGGSGESEYNYDMVFGEDANTNKIYNEVVSDMVESATKDGINGTVFTYGQTSSGKTFTMQGCGGSDNSVGIIQLAAKEIFQTIKEEKSDDSNSECSVRVSYVEIYNEELRDLLNDKSRKTSTSLIIREDKEGSISVEGLKEVAVNSLEQLMGVFRVGEANKSVGSTKMNDRSSRSHAILKIILERKTVINAVDDKENSPGRNNPSDLVVKTTSALNLVDLAGSESVRHTGASGMQKKEGGMINQSLLTLSKVLMSLGQKNPGHINYRDSKLTRILKPSLSGNARMTVICCISPSDKYVEETRSTLQFAMRAKLVKTNAVVNEVVDDSDLIAKLRLESARAKWENRKLEDQLREMATINSSALSTKRELDNLKKFVFIYVRNSSNRVFNGSEFHTDEHCNLGGRTGSALTQTDYMTNYAASKDDLDIRHSCDEVKDCGIIFRAALDFKARQVKHLEVQLKGSKLRQEPKAAKEKRYSLISETRSPDIDRRISKINALRSPDANEAPAAEDDRRISMINETRSPDSSEKEGGNPKRQYQDIDSSERAEFESKLTNANSLIAGLERQIDDLSSQKNDALDWIEELFAKSDQKDEKIRQACEERNDAIKRCEDLDNELMKSKELLSSASMDTLTKNEKLSLEVVEEMNSLQRALDAQNESADKVEELYLELATVKEKYETAQDTLCQ
ncbi:LOW QUALITY PROTEIN: hypothetical protein ACHAXR_003436, partial [Thalassiosira sp. AJA248-18]